jgi:hypothetical protein
MWAALLRTLVPVADLHHQGVQVDDRVDLLQRPGLPRLDLLQHRVGDIRDRLVGQFRAQRAGQVVLDVAHRHPTRVQRDDHVVEAAGAALPLGHQPRLERRPAIPRHRQRHLTDLGGQGLRRRPVTRVRTTPPGRITLLIAEMVAQLGLQTPFQHRPDHLRQEPALAGQPQSVTIDPFHQPIKQTGLDHVVDRIPSRTRPNLLILCHGHLCTPSSRILYTDHLTPPALPDSRVSEAVIDVLVGLMRRLPAELRKTLTWDQGAEMATHPLFTLATDCQVYFCDPRSPWQRGSNENTNGLLRQYFPRSSTDFRVYTQDQLDTVARELNGRPRETLDWKNPARAINELLVATAG